MPKPSCSVVDEPRPVPNSKRPLAEVVEHRDPLGDAGRVVHRRRDVEDARADVDALGAGERRSGSNTSLAEMWEYSSRKWCSVIHQYFQLVSSARTARVDLAQQATMLGLAVVETPETLGVNPPQNSPNSIGED